MSDFTFEPWKTFEPKSKSTLEIDVPEPPCKHCALWKPERTFRLVPGIPGHVFDGVVLCHAKQMNMDFSCFVSEDGKK